MKPILYALLIVAVLLSAEYLSAAEDPAPRTQTRLDQEYHAYLMALVKAYQVETAKFVAVLQREAAAAKKDAEASAAIAALQGKITDGRQLPEFIALVGGQAGGDAGQGEWSQWRGPHRDGISPDTGLLPALPAAGPPLIWKATGLGLSYSSISVAKGRIYTMGDVDDSCCVLAIEAASGKILWTAKLNGAWQFGDKNLRGPRCTPTVDGNQVFAISPQGDVVALESATGKEVWHKSMKGDLGGKDAPGWGFSESPLVDGERVCITPGGPQGTIAALNRQTGAIVWQSKEIQDGAQYSSLIIATIGGVRQYVQLTANSVFGVAPETGKLLWKAQRKGSTAVVSTPVVKDDCVYVTSGYGVGCNLFKVTNDKGQLSATEVYANKDMCNHHGNVILLRNYVYGYSDSLGFECMEFATGKVMWSSKSVGKGSVAYAEGHIYLREEGDKGTVSMIAATPEMFHVDGKFDQPERSKLNSWAHPVISGSRLYLHDGDILFCYDLKGR